MPGTAALHIVCNQVSKMCKRKLVMNQVGSYCKVTENKHFYNALLKDKLKQSESSK